MFRSIDYGTSTLPPGYTLGGGVIVGNSFINYGLGSPHENATYVTTDFLNWNLSGLSGAAFGVVNPIGGAAYLDNTNIAASDIYQTSDFISDVLVGEGPADFNLLFADGLEVFAFDTAFELELARSSDGGVNFGASFATDFFTLQAVALHTQNTIINRGGAFFYCTNVACYRSDDDGATWVVDGTKPLGACIATENGDWLFQVTLGDETSTVYMQYSDDDFQTFTDYGSLVVGPYSGIAIDSFLLTFYGDDVDGARTFVLYLVGDSGDAFTFLITDVPAVVETTSGNQAATGGGVNGAGGAVGFSGVSASNSSGISLASLAYPAGIVPRGVNDFGIDLGL